MNGNDSHSGRRSTRPWTTGELDDNDSGDGATNTSTGGFLQYDGGLQSRARSADGVSLSPHPVDTDLPSTGEHPDDAVDLLHAKTDGLVSSAEDVSKNSDVFGTSGADRQVGQGEKRDIGDGIDGAADDDDGCEKSDFPGVLPEQMTRRVSFADEQGLDNPSGSSNGHSDGSMDSTEEPNSQNQHRAGLGAQRRRLSGMVGSSSSYLEGDGSINGHLTDKDGRRKSDIERCRKAMEIARVAHELLFLDTRPDGLRPITGTPMANGKTAEGQGGLYVGLAGLRGFDLSFAGAVPTDPSDTRQNLGSVAARLAANRRLSACTAAADKDETSMAGGSLSSSPNRLIASPSKKADASWIAQGFLLDRKPGSLVPRLPRSAGRAPVAEIGRIPPTTKNNGEVNDEGGKDLPASETAPSNGRSPKVTKGNKSESSPLSPASCSSLQQAQRSAMEDDNTTAKSSSSNPSLRAKEGTPQTQDTLDEGSEQIGLGGAVCGRSRRVERTRTEFEGESGALPVPGAPFGTTVVSSAATAMASLFTPKAAVLWSARDLGVDELVFSIAGDQEVKKTLDGFLSCMFVSRCVVWSEVSTSHCDHQERCAWHFFDGDLRCLLPSLAYTALRRTSGNDRGGQMMGESRLILLCVNVRLISSQCMQRVPWAFRTKERVLEPRRVTIVKLGYR